MRHRRGSRAAEVPLSPLTRASSASGWAAYPSPAPRPQSVPALEFRGALASPRRRPGLLAGAAGVRRPVVAEVERRRKRAADGAATEVAGHVQSSAVRGAVAEHALEAEVDHE